MSTAAQADVDIIMDEKQPKPNEEEFISFMMKVLDFKEASIASLKETPHGTDIYLIRSIALGGGYTGYKLEKCRFITFHEDMNAVELEDLQGTYIGHVPLDKEGHPAFTINKFTGKHDPLERLFLSYYEAMKYMHQIKYVCDVKEEDYLLGVLQGIKKYDK